MPPASSNFREYASYWAIVWEQFKKNRTAYGALWAIGLLFAIAIYAPVFASKVPFYWRDASGTSFPWVRGLLFNRNVFEGPVDLFFNLLLVASPVGLAAVAFVGGMRARLDVRAHAKLSRRVFGGLAIAIVVAFVIIAELMEPRQAIPDYRALSWTATDTKFLFAPLRISYDDTLHGVAGEGVRNLLGIDNAGRDIFVRLIYGTRVSLSVGVIAVSIYIAIGTVLGAVGGYFGGRTDLVVQRLVEVFLCFPSFFLIMAFIGFLPQPSLIAVMVIIGLVGWTGPARLVRGEFLRLKNVDFVTAARACGFSNNRIIFRHILPNALGPVLVNATFGVASAVLVESSLAFLGIGDPTLPSWGRILAYGRATGDSWMMVIAGMAIFVTVSVFNLAGEGIRDAIDPKLRK